MDKQESIIAKRCAKINARGTKVPVRSWAQRGMVFKLYWTRRVLISSNGLIKVNGLWIRNKKSLDLPIVLNQFHERMVDSHLVNVSHTSHPEPMARRLGAWARVGVLLMTDTIPAARLRALAL